MSNPLKPLPRLQKQMQRLWERIEAETDPGMRDFHKEKYAGLERLEFELLTEIRSAGVLEKRR